MAMLFTIYKIILRIIIFISELTIVNYTMRALYPQEIEVFYIIPALRRELTLALKAQGHDQKKIAQWLGVTEAAVSNYVRNKRAKDIAFSAAVVKRIKEAALRVTDHATLFEETQHLLKLTKQSGAVCAACRTYADRDVPDNCRSCFDEAPNVSLPTSH